MKGCLKLDKAEKDFSVDEKPQEWSESKYAINNLEISLAAYLSLYSKPTMLQLLQ